MAPSTSIIAALLFAVGASLAHAEGDDNALQQKLTRLGYQSGESVDRIENYRVDGWNYLDDRHIMISAGPSRRFLIELMTNCQNLSTTERIAFTTTVQRLTRFDSLIVRGPGGITQNCPIRDMHELTPIKNKGDEKK